MCGNPQKQNQGSFLACMTIKWKSQYCSVIGSPLPKGAMLSTKVTLLYDKCEDWSTPEGLVGFLARSTHFITFQMTMVTLSLIPHELQ